MVVITLPSFTGASVADAGYLEGGFYYNYARKARAKISKPRPLLLETTRIFDRFGEKPCVNGPVFDRDFAKAC